MSAKGLTTSPIAHGSRVLELHFDFNKHVLNIDVSDGKSAHIALEPRSVADFYGALMRALVDLGLPVTINEFPCEIPGATPFSGDLTHVTYDPKYAQRFWRVLVQVDRVLKQFRTAFLGKCSPVHFFWGSFDLAVTRFSGRSAPVYTRAIPGVATDVMREAYSHEVSSAGFWPGGDGVDYPSFYSYAYPTPEAFAKFSIQPERALFNEALGLFMLPYDAIRNAKDPDANLLSFLQSTYQAAARSAGWDEALECAVGIPGVPRSSQPSG